MIITALSRCLEKYDAPPEGVTTGSLDYGSITRLESQYVLGLRALQCKTCDLLAQDQETAESREHVLHALGVAAGKLRRKLGVSAVLGVCDSSEAGVEATRKAYLLRDR